MFARSPVQVAVPGDERRVFLPQGQSRREVQRVQSAQPVPDGQLGGPLRQATIDLDDADTAPVATLLRFAFNSVTPISRT